MGFFHWNPLCNSIQWYVNQFDITFSTVHKAFDSHFLLDRASILSTGSLQLTIEEFLEKPLHPPPEISVDITRGVVTRVHVPHRPPQYIKMENCTGITPESGSIFYTRPVRFDTGSIEWQEWRGKLPNTYFSFSMMCKEFNSEQKQGLISVPELLLETDSPYLSLSSDIQINNPRFLGNVTLIVAGLRGMQIAEVLANGWSLFS